jgi:hypothetical protein
MTRQIVGVLDYDRYFDDVDIWRFEGVDHLLQLRFRTLDHWEIRNWGHRVSDYALTFWCPWFDVEFF